MTETEKAQAFLGVIRLIVGMRSEVTTLAIVHRRIVTGSLELSETELSRDEREAVKDVLAKAAEMEAAITHLDTFAYANAGDDE